MGGDQSTEQLLAQALEALDLSVSIAAADLPDQPLVYVNPAFEQTTGYPVDEVLGRNCRFLQDGLAPQPQVAVLRAALEAREPISVVLLNRRRDGSHFLNELTVTPLHDDEGQVSHFLAVQRDVGRQEEQARRRADLEREQQELLHTLQGNLVPETLPDVPGLDVAVRYQPGTSTTSGAAVSGDFYDLYATTSTAGAAATWNAVIGDVAGRGAGAAAYTSTVRNLLKGIGLTEGAPSQSLELLNRALLDELGDRFVTVALAQLQVRTDRVRATLALGGHPQPVLVHDGEPTLVGTPGDLIGVLPEHRATDERVDLVPGDTLLLYTDGITEAGPVSDQFGEDRLLEAAAGGGDAGAVADAVLDAVRQHAGQSEDDSALLALQVEEPRAEPSPDGPARGSGRG